MKHWFRGMSLGVLLSANTLVSAELGDTIAAKVDDEVILLSEIRGQVNNYLFIIQEESTSQADYEKKVAELLDETLEESIETKILYREAVRFAIEVHYSRVEKSLEKFRVRFKTEEEFMAYLSKAGVSLSDFRERERKSLMAGDLARTKLFELQKEQIIAESDVEAFYNENKDEFTEPEEIRLRQIMIRARRDTVERKQAIAKLNQLREKIIAGADFEAMAKQHSQDPAAAEGGIIGWQKGGQLTQAIEEVAFALKRGDVSQVVETPLGVYLLRVDDRKEATALPLQEARLNIERALRSKMASEQYDKWIDDLRRRSKVRIFIK